MGKTVSGVWSPVSLHPTCSIRNSFSFLPRLLFDFGQCSIRWYHSLCLILLLFPTLKVVIVFSALKNAWNRHKDTFLPCIGRRDGFGAWDQLWVVRGHWPQKKGTKIVRVIWQINPSCAFKYMGSDRWARCTQLQLQGPLGWTDDECGILPVRGVANL